MSQHFGMFSATVNVGHEESVYSRVTYVDGSPAPRHRALDALCTLAVNARLPYFMNHSTVDGDNFTGVVRNLVRCAAASPQFPKDNDVVCVPNPARVWAPGDREHTALEYEQAPFADIWRVDKKSPGRDRPVILRWFGTIQLLPSAVMPAKDDLPPHLRIMGIRLSYYMGLREEGALYAQVIGEFPSILPGAMFENPAGVLGSHRAPSGTYGSRLPSYSQGGRPATSARDTGGGPGWRDSGYLGESFTVSRLGDSIGSPPGFRGCGQGTRGKDGEQEELGTVVVSQFCIYDLDDNLRVAQTKKDIKERLRRVQGLLRMTSDQKQETILRDLEFRSEQVHSTLRGRMHSSCGDQLSGFESLHRLPPIWDLGIFKSPETLSAFFLLEGFRKWDWTEMSLAKFIAKDRETDLGWGQEARRGARSLLLTCVRRFQEALVVLFDGKFDKVLEPLEELQEAAFQQHMNGFLRFYIEKMLAGFMICVREERHPDVPGYENWRMSSPSECAVLLRGYSENLMFRFGSKRYSAGVGPTELLELPPHTYFFGPEGPWTAVTQPPGPKVAVVSPEPKHTGTPGVKNTTDEVAGLKRTLERVTQELAEVKSQSKVHKASRPEVCLDFLAEEYGVKVGAANSPWVCRLGVDCPRHHPSNKSEGWKSVKRADWLTWGVTGTVKSKLADLVPNFDASWA